MRTGPKAEKLLMWIVPPVGLGAYLWVSWWFSRWHSGEAMIFLLILVAIGLAAVALGQLRIWHKGLLALLYAPLMCALLFWLLLYPVGCGVFGECL